MSLPNLVSKAISKNDYFHVFNKTIDNKKIFSEPKLAEKFIELAKYYRSTEAIVSYSKISELDPYDKDMLYKQVNSRKTFGIEVLAYCLMPNHFHFLLQERIEGYSIFFISTLLNSYTKYFNTRFDRAGPLFIGRTKKKEIYTEEQFLHLIRYINLNPYSSGVVSNLTYLNCYDYCSFKDYFMKGRNKLTSSSSVLKMFSSKDSLKEFILERGEYQKDLKASP